MDAEQITNEMAKVIDGILNRPSMYVGGLNSHDAAYQLDTLLNVLIHLWSFAHHRQAEFQREIDTLKTAEGCGPMPLPAYFESQYPEKANEDCSRYVLEQWNMIARRLGVTPSAK